MQFCGRWRRPGSFTAQPCGALRSLTASSGDRKSTRLNSSHTVIYTLSLHYALPISSGAGVMDAILWAMAPTRLIHRTTVRSASKPDRFFGRSEEHTSELQSHRDLHSFPTLRSSDLIGRWCDGCNFVGDGADQAHSPHNRAERFEA